MHNAPSVSYPVGRCAFQRTCFAGLLLGACLVLGVWLSQQTLGGAMILGVLCALVASVWGWKSLQHRGTLSWNGQVWCLHDRGGDLEDALGVLQVALDVQQALLLRWQPTSDTLHAKPIWLWFGAEHARGRWQDLRRAVYQHSEMN
ncbi:hypothetical protein [Limnohabitans sp.]|uniref:hypothetical protein n=1 Tax=Limnohabitans sp. TaxID=1907725 RepID=UPI00286F72A5|nr:hypothetical protein [Limnohabitans sp.]